jgi:ribonuclease HI
MVTDHIQLDSQGDGLVNAIKATLPIASKSHLSWPDGARLHSNIRSVLNQCFRRQHGENTVAPATSTPSLILQVDGALGFPPRGVAGLGIVVRNIHGVIFDTITLRAPASTNNEAEYLALIAGLDVVRRHYPQAELRCLSDSRVVLEQVLGRSRVRATALKPLHQRATQLVMTFAQIEFVLIPRELNRLADALAWEALDGREALCASTGM